MGESIVAHHGRRTAFRAPDGGTRAVAVHGPAMRGYVWETLLEADPLGGVASVELSGRGRSSGLEADPGWETLAAYASDVIAVARDVGASTYIGHGLGAAVALHAVAHRSHPFDAFVLIGIGQRLPIPEDMHELAASDIEGLRAFLEAPGRAFADPDDDARAALARSMRGIDTGVASRDLTTCHRFAFSSPSSFDVPTLVCCGSEDGITPPAGNAVLADRLPQGRFTSIEGAAHCPMIERPDMTAECIGPFLREHASRST